LKLDFDKFDDLADENNEVKLALEAIGSAVDVEALGRLLASLDKVINNLGFDFELMF
jgi:hypothetical protein